MVGSKTGGEIEFGEGCTDRESVLERFADDEIGAARVGPEAGGIAVQVVRGSASGSRFRPNGRWTDLDRTAHIR